MSHDLDRCLSAMRAEPAPGCPQRVTHEALRRVRRETRRETLDADPLARVAALVPRTLFTLPALAAAVAFGAVTAFVTAQAHAPDRRELAARSLGLDSIHAHHLAFLEKHDRSRP